MGNVIEKVTNAGTVYKESKYYYWEPQSGMISLACNAGVILGRNTRWTRFLIAIEFVTGKGLPPLVNYQLEIDEESC